MITKVADLNFRISRVSQTGLIDRFLESESFPVMNLGFTAGAFGALFASIKHLEMFGVFVKGAASSHRNILTHTVSIDCSYSVLGC